MSNLIQSFAEKSGLNLEQSEKILGGTFVFIKIQLKNDYEKIVAEIPEATTLGSLYMKPDSAASNTDKSNMMSNQFGMMMKMMSDFSKSGITQDRLQKLTPIAFEVIGSKLTESSRNLIVERMPVFKNMLEGKPSQNMPGIGALLNPLFGKK